MTNEPIKRDNRKNGNNFDETKRNSIIRRCKNAACNYARKNVTPANVLKAAVPNSKQLIATPLEILVAGIAFQNLKLFQDPLKHAKGAAYFGTHATQTIIDAAQGGPAGMRAAIKLEEAIKTLEKESATDENAAKALREYYTSKKEFVQELVKVYKENETFALTCDRLGAQIRGMVHNVLEIGNDLPIPFQKDLQAQYVLTLVKMNRSWNPNYEKYKGMTDTEILVQAARDNKVIGKLYEVINDFYKGRKLNENTVDALCKSLKNYEGHANNQNKEIEAYFPQIIQMVKDGYSIERVLLELEKRGVFIEEDELKGADQKVKKYKEKGVELREGIKSEGVPMKEDPAYNLIDLAMNPFVLATAAVLAYKGLTRTIPFMGFADDQISKVIALPATATWYGAKKGVKALYNKGKKYLGGEKNENPEGTSN